MQRVVHVEFVQAGHGVEYVGYVACSQLLPFEEVDEERADVVWLSVVGVEAAVVAVVVPFLLAGVQGVCGVFVALAFDPFDDCVCV